jgi:diacylglycerol kinase
MNKIQNWTLIIRIHQLLILVLLVFSLFVKPEVKKVFWLIMGGAILSLLIQVFLFNMKQDSYKDKVSKHPHEY